MNIQTAQSQMKRARTALVFDQPFFASLLLRLQLTEDKSCETMWTDGRKLGYNPTWVENLSIDEVKGVLCHEVMHIAASHQVRRGGREHDNWNSAGDLAINPLIEDSGLKLPEGRLREARFDGKSAEEIYRVLSQEQGNQQNDAQKPQDGQGQGQGGNDPNGQQEPSKGQGSGDGEGEKDGNESGDGEGSGQPQKKTGDPGKCGEVRDAPAEDGGQAGEADRSKQEADWKIAVAAAAQNAKARGQLPAAMDRYVTDLLDPKVDWREVLRRFITNAAKRDFSWSRPNRRYVGQHLYLPAVVGNDLPPIVVAVDTSESIGNDLLAQFSAELTSICAELPISTVKVVYCDAAINRTEEFTKDDLPLQLKACGGGGTDFAPVFEHIEKECQEEPACCVYLTDLYGSFPSEEPTYPVLWATVGIKCDAPFGEVVPL